MTQSLPPTIPTPRSEYSERRPCERQHGLASRSFALASNIDEAKADAKYQSGVLELRLPKKATGSSKKLSVG